jgi:hypothetical protein
VFLEQLRLWHHVVIDEEDVLPDGGTDARIAGGCRSPIGLR